VKNEQVTCDGCGHDLTVRTNSVDYRLVLGSESKPGYGSGAYTDMMIYPPIDRTHHFCNLQCLDHWRDREHHYEKAYRDRSEAWRAPRTTVHPGGSRSYPSPPAELSDAWEAESRAAALAAFPLERQGGRHRRGWRWVAPVSEGEAGRPGFDQRSYDVGYMEGENSARADVEHAQDELRIALERHDADHS
jgi:hypothetical protein